MEFLKHQDLIFDYVNWRGVKSKRRVRTEKIYWGSTEYHKEPQWIMLAFDIDKQAYREFAMKDMFNVTHAGNCKYCDGWGAIRYITDESVHECEMCNGTGSR
jgi:hypothetical protein